MTEMLTPKFLTEEIARLAVEQVLAAVTKPPLGNFLKRHLCHIVVLVPSMSSGSPEGWPNFFIEPHALYQHSVGPKEEWTAPYDEIAQCKALQLWHGRNDDRTDIMPHLLFPGDTPFWGGVRRHGIVVTCSGAQSWFDKMIAGMVADVCVALAYDAWMTSEERRENSRFLS